MKKTLITITAILAGCLTYAQSTDSVKASKLFDQINSESSLKPRKNNVATELNINPFKGELSLNNSLNQIKFRIFSSPTFAWRIGFSGSRLDSVLEYGSPYGENPVNYKRDLTSTTVGMNLGFEKHFKGTKRLSPYLGLDISITNKSSKQETTQGQVSSTIKGVWQTTYTEYIPYNGGTYTRYINSQRERAFIRYGLNLVSGFDFYIAKHFFFGYELNFGFNQTDYKKVKYSQTGISGSTPNSTSNNSDFKDSNFSFGPTLMNGIRLGYVL